jgi:hypothetical protein
MTCRVLAVYIHVPVLPPLSVSLNDVGRRCSKEGVGADFAPPVDHAGILLIPENRRQ